MIHDPRFIDHALILGFYTISEPENELIFLDIVLEKLFRIEALGAAADLEMHPWLGRGRDDSDFLTLGDDIALFDRYFLDPAIHRQIFAAEVTNQNDGAKPAQRLADKCYLATGCGNYR